MQLRTALVSTLLSLVLIPTLALAANTGVDTSFGPDSGHYRFDRDSSDDWVHDSAMDSQGRILLAFLIEDSGTPGLYYPAVMRLTADGYGDPSFGFLGLWVESTVDATIEVPVNITVDAQDRPILGWTYEFDQGGTPNRDWWVRRLTTGGATDDGTVIALDIGIAGSGDRLDEMTDIMVLADGRIVAVGRSQYDGTDWDGAVGVVVDDPIHGLIYDTGFSSDGRATVNYDLSGSSKYDTVSAVTVDHTGNLALVGWSHSSSGNVVTVSRLNKTTGTLDTTFHSDGKATYAYTPLLDPSLPARGVAVALSNSGLFVGVALRDGDYYRIGVLGVEGDGDVDMTFGLNGWYYLAPTYPGMPFDSASTLLSGLARDNDRLIFSASIEDPLDHNQGMGVVGVLTLAGAGDADFAPGGYDFYWFEPDGEQNETGFSSVLIPGTYVIGVSAGEAVLTGGMRGVTSGGSRTDGDLLATRVATDPGLIFSDGFETGTTDAWSAP